MYIPLLIPSWFSLLLILIGILALKSSRCFACKAHKKRTSECEHPCGDAGCSWQENACSYTAGKRHRMYSKNHRWPLYILIAWATLFLTFPLLAILAQIALLCLGLYALGYFFWR